MNIRDLRKSSSITQQKASEILGVPLRTYIRYESEEKYQKTLKYQKMYEVLENFLKVDEEHGLLTIDEIKRIVKEVFDKYDDIEFAFLFGSYAKGHAVPMSDVDILVSTNITGLAFFGLIEELREALHKKVDLIALKDIKPESKLIYEIFKSGKRIYGEYTDEI